MNSFEKSAVFSNLLGLGFSPKSIIEEHLPLHQSYMASIDRGMGNISENYIRHVTEKVDGRTSQMYFLFHYGLYFDLAYSIAFSEPKMPVRFLVRGEGDDKTVMLFKRVARIRDLDVEFITVSSRPSFLKSISKAINDNALFVCFLDMPNPGSTVGLADVSLLESTLHLRDGLFKIAERYSVETTALKSIPDGTGAKLEQKKVSSLEDVVAFMEPTIKEMPHCWRTLGTLHQYATLQDRGGVFLRYAVDEFFYLFDCGAMKFFTIGEDLYDEIGQKPSSEFLEDLSEILPDYCSKPKSVFTL